MKNPYALEHLSNDELIEGTHRAASESNRATAVLLAHLAEIDRRKLYLDKAKSSMFQYVVDVFGLSESAAYLRINVARAARKHPEIFELVSKGTLHLTAIKLTAPHLTDDNHTELLAAVRGKRAREVEKVLAHRFPKPDVPQVLRKLPERAGARAASLAGSGLARGEPKDALPAPCKGPSKFQNLLTAPSVSSAQDRPTTAATILSPKRYKLQVTLSEETQAKLRQAQRLLKHRVPNGDLAEVLDRALDALLEREMKQKFGATDRPQKRGRSRSGAAKEARKPRAAACKAETEPESRPNRESERPRRRSRHVPNAVRREVLERDGLQCSFVSEDGERCQERAGLELHHSKPFEKGGEHTAENVRIYCKAHNAHAAERDYGAQHMARYRRQPELPLKARERREPYAA